MHQITLILTSDYSEVDLVLENSSEKKVQGLHKPWVVKLLQASLRTVPTIVTAHIFCACQGSRARRERNAQHAGHADWFCLL